MAQASEQAFRFSGGDRQPAMTSARSPESISQLAKSIRQAWVSDSGVRDHFKVGA